LAKDSAVATTKFRNYHYSFPNSSSSRLVEQLRLEICCHFLYGAWRLSLNNNPKVELLIEGWQHSQLKHLLVNKIRADWLTISTTHPSPHSRQQTFAERVSLFLQDVADELAVDLKLDYCYFFSPGDQDQIPLNLSHVTTQDWIVNEVRLDSCLQGREKTARWIQERRLSDHPQFPGSILIPVVRHGERMGVMVCLSRQPRYWLAGEIILLAAVFEEINYLLAAGIQPQSLSQYQQLAKREQLINQITSQTRSSLDLKTILTGAIAHLCQALSADRCIVHLVEDPADLDPNIRISKADSQVAFRRRHLYEFCQPPFPRTIDDFDTHGPITEWVINHQQAVVIDDITQDERIGADNLEYQQAQIRSSLVIPVQTADKLYAILYVNQCADLRHWSADDQHLVQTVADQLAIAIQQAHLYAQTRQQALKSEAQAQQLATTLKELQLTQAQLIQSEKMSSLDQLVAGVAHELNNPVSFIHGNLPYLETYFADLLHFIQVYQRQDPQSSPLEELAQELDLEFLQRDIPNILNSMKSGTIRIQEIIQVLQNFARLNESPVKSVKLHIAIENILLILKTKLSPVIQIHRDYEEVSSVECYPKQINQAFLSILTNGIEALNRSPKPERHLRITLRKVAATSHKPAGVEIAIADNGEGIPFEIQSRIFDPFFTTKEIGQGRGLGLTAAYQIIVDQHHGEIQVHSQPNQGTEFCLFLPLSLSTAKVSASHQLIDVI
jgi:two-component system NtrC family sensor kinase